MDKVTVGALESASGEAVNEFTPTPIDPMIPTPNQTLAPDPIAIPVTIPPDAIPIPVTMPPDAIAIPATQPPDAIAISQNSPVNESMNNDKKTPKAMRIAISISGVESASFVGSDKEQIVVTGDGIDSVQLSISVGISNLKGQSFKVDCSAMTMTMTDINNNLGDEGSNTPVSKPIRGGRISSGGGGQTH